MDTENIIDIGEETSQDTEDIKKPKNIPLRIIDIAKATKIQDGSIRHYRNRFYKYMPVVGEGRKRRYQPYVVELMLDIQKGFNKGLTWEEIDKVLAERYPVCQFGDINPLDDDEEDIEENKLMAMPMPDQVNTMAGLLAKHIPQIGERLDSMNNKIYGIEETVTAQFTEVLNRLDQVINENKELKNEVKELKEKKKSIFDKWFNKKVKED